MNKRQLLNVPLTGADIQARARAELPNVTFRGGVLRAKTGNAVDLVFVIDTTGSMSDKIEGVLATCEEFLRNFAVLGLDYRVGIVAFGDLTVPGDSIVAMPFMKELEMIQKELRSVPRYGGGGNDGESSLEAVHAALDMPYRAEAVKVCILITDEPALHINHFPAATTATLNRREVITYVISPAIDYFKAMANQTGGEWLQITSAADFSSLLSMLRELSRNMAKIVTDVHLLAHGSVQTYLKLGKPKV